MLKLLTWLFVLLAALSACLYFFFFDVWVVPGDDPLLSASIQPTLAPGDVVILFRHSSVGRGELLRCDDPEAPGRFIVARAIARSNERIAFDGEVPVIDGHRTVSPRACEEPTTVVRDPNSQEDVELLCSVEGYGENDFGALRAATQRADRDPGMTVEPGTWFLVSDDRHIHLDSRDFGPIEPRTCRHILFRVVGASGLGDARTRFSVIW